MQCLLCWKVTQFSTDLNKVSIPFVCNRATDGTGSLYLDTTCLCGRIEVIRTPVTIITNFALQIAEDSMLLLYKSKDIVFVKSQSDIKTDEIGIFSYNRSLIIRKRDGDSIVAINNSYPVISMNVGNNIKCYGKVIGKL